MPLVGLMPKKAAPSVERLLTENHLRIPSSSLATAEEDERRTQHPKQR